MLYSVISLSVLCISTWWQNIISLWKIEREHFLQIAFLSKRSRIFAHTLTKSSAHGLSFYVQSICLAELYVVCVLGKLKAICSLCQNQPSTDCTVTQRTVKNTCRDDEDGRRPRQHMVSILGLMKTTWHKYCTKRPTIGTCTIPLPCCCHWNKH